MQWVWPCVLLGGIAGMWMLMGFGFVNVVMIVMGVLSMQIVFVASHMEAHAQFMNYSQHQPGTIIENRPPVYLAAFMHHHQEGPEVWFPDLHAGNPVGYHNILVAHWTSYSMLLSMKVWLVCAMMGVLNARLGWYFCGYELAVWMLPYAHGWQHAARERMRYVPKLMIWMLVGVGLVADRADHVSHHRYDHPTVYQNFSSSGFYARWVDAHLNAIWDDYYHLAKKRKVDMYGLLHHRVWYVNRIVLVGVPMMIWILM